MGMMDNIKHKMEDMDMDSMRARYEELRRKDENGQLDDKGREELGRLRERMGQ